MQFHVIPNCIARRFVNVRCIQFSVNLIYTICQRRAIVFCFLCPLQNRFPLIQNSLFHITGDKPLYIAQGDCFSVRTVKAKFIAIKPPIAPRECAHMVLHFCTGEKQAFQEELRKFTTCNVRIVSVRAVRRLHNAGTFRPCSVICNIA